jgi:MraZ protein
MSSFKGSYAYSVDSKGRINIPAKLRKYISNEAPNNFVLTRGYEKCLYVYPVDEWKKLEEMIRSLSGTNPKHRFFKRALMENASDVELDAQSRIVISKELLQYAEIENEVMILGVLDHIEVWNPKLYKEYQETQKESYEDIAQTVLQK